MLAEWFLITQLASVPELASHLDDLAGHHVPALLTLLAHASDHMPAAVPLYARLIQADPAGRVTAGADAALTASAARPRLDAALAAVVTSTRWSPGALASLNRHLPEGTLPRTRAAVAAATVDHARETGTPEHLAEALNSYGASLADLGRHRDALAAKKRRWPCTGTGRRQPRPPARPRQRAEQLRHRPDRPGTAPGRAGRQERGAGPVPGPGRRQPRPPARPRQRAEQLRRQPADLGRHRETLAAEEEALALYRDLAAANPAHQPALASALNSYGISLTDLGRHRDALAAEEEALALYRDLAAANPAHQPALARALNNYGDSLTDLGRHRDALAAEEEALALYRDLAAANPAHQPALASALNSYGVSLRDLGRHRDALAASRRRWPCTGIWPPPTPPTSPPSPVR